MTNTLDRIYDDIRLEERAALEARVTDAYARAPRLAKIDSERQRVFADVGARTLSPADGVAAIERLAEEERGILHALGLPDDTLSLRYRCAECRDTGYVGSAPSRPCACRLLYRERAKAGTGINERETFANFSADVYRDDMQKKRALNAKRLCEAYAAELPRPEKPNLLILGMPGLGKSYLGNAVAHAALENGIDAARITTYRFVQDMLLDIREHTSNAHRYSNVPLLVLDDLGSEPDIPNVSVEWLFAVINERVQGRLATVCISNLSLLELMNRYGERLMSRLADRNTTTALQLTGDNLRTL